VCACVFVLYLFFGGFLSVMLVMFVLLHFMRNKLNIIVLLSLWTCFYIESCSRLLYFMFFCAFTASYVKF